MARTRDEAPRRTPARGRVHLLLGLLALGPVVASVGLCVLGLVDLDTLRAIGDRLAVDGHAESLTGDAGVEARSRFLAAGVLSLAVSLGAAALGLLHRGTLVGIALSTPARIAAWRRSVGRFVADEPWHAGALGLFVLVYVGLAVGSLAKPITCDEAYTSIYFASKPFRYILTNYVSPNNHVLHSLLARASRLLFGDEPWALRLPVLAAGLATVPTAYVAVRVHLGRLAALIAAGFVASWPYLIDVTTNARGYPFLHLAFLVLLGFGPSLFEPRRSGAWLAVVLASIAGFFAIPLMVFPFAVFLVWYGASALSRPRAERVRAAGRMGVAIAAIGIGTAALYLPSALVQGSGIAFLRPYLRPELGADGELVAGLGFLFAYVWDLWTFDVPVPLALVLAPLALVAVVPPGRRARAAGLLAAASVLGPVAVAILTGRIPPPRTFSFLLLVLLALAAAGLVRVAELLGRGDARRVAAAAGAVLALVVASNALSSWSHRREQWRLPWYVGYYDAPAAAEHLAEVLRPGDRVSGLREDRPPVHYYYLRRTGHDFVAFSGRGTPTWRRIRPVLATDMLATDTAETVGDVYLLDTYVEDVAFLERILSESGFRPTEDVLSLPHSRIVRYTRESGSADEGYGASERSDVGPGDQVESPDAPATEVVQKG